MLTVEEQAEHVDEWAWDDFVSELDATVDYSSKYRGLLADLLERPDESLVLRERAGGVSRIRAVLPLFSAEGPYGRVYNSLPYFGGSGGILADSEESASHLRDQYVALLDNAASGCIVESQRGFQHHEGIPFTHTSERIAHFTDIEGADEADLIDSFEKRAVASIRKAKASGVTVSVRTGDADALDWLRRTQAENMRAVGAPPKSDRFFELLVEHFLPWADYDLYIASIRNEYVAGALLLYFNGIVDYYTPAIEPGARPQQPLSALLLRAMADSAAAGRRLWNWGATHPDLAGVRLFKRQWASSERPFQYLIQVNNDDLLEASPAELVDAYPSFYVLPFDHKQ